jgi:hypothetical protein
MSNGYDSPAMDVFPDTDGDMAVTSKVNQEEVKAVNARWRYEVLMEERRLNALLRDEYDL